MKLKYLLMAVAGLGLFSSCESDEPRQHLYSTLRNLPTEYMIW